MKKLPRQNRARKFPQRRRQHTQGNGSQCSTAVAAAGIVPAVVVRRFACVSKDCAANPPQGNSNINWWYPRGTSWYFTGTTDTSLIPDTRYHINRIYGVRAFTTLLQKTGIVRAPRDKTCPSHGSSGPPAPPIIGATSQLLSVTNYVG